MSASVEVPGMGRVTIASIALCSVTVLVLPARVRASKSRRMRDPRRQGDCVGPVSSRPCAGPGPVGGGTRGTAGGVHL